MTLSIFVLLLLSFIFLYSIIIEIFTVIFRLTGMTEKSAKFQVISLLTNSGFTTQESEAIMTSRKRRKLAIFTMFFGYTFTVVLLSIFINVLIAAMNTDMKGVTYSIFYLIGFTLLYTILLKFPKIKFLFDNIIKKISNKFMKTKRSNPFLILDFIGKYVVGEMIVTNIPVCLVNTTISDAEIRQYYNISILAIKRKDLVITNIGPDTTIKKYDTLILYGEINKIYLLFSL